jgi:hypothetical protein
MFPCFERMSAGLSASYRYTQETSISIPKFDHWWNRFHISVIYFSTLLTFRRKGYIAGVTNPMFKQRSEMWDLVCDLDTGEVIKNEETYAASLQQTPELEQYPSDSHNELDLQFLQQIISMVNSHALKGVNHAYSEDSVRSHYQVI